MMMIIDNGGNDGVDDEVNDEGWAKGETASHAVSIPLQSLFVGPHQRTENHQTLGAIKLFIMEINMGRWERISFGFYNTTYNS